MTRYFNLIKVLMPFVLWIFGIGGVKGIVDLIRYHLRVTTNSALLILTGLIIGSIALIADPDRAIGAEYWPRKANVYSAQTYLRYR